MSVLIPNGTSFSIAASYSPAIPITAITNASCAVVEAKNTLKEGDIVEIVSAWTELSDKIYRVTNPTADTFGLENIDTTNTDNFPDTGGTGFYRKIDGWKSFSEILGNSSSGGEQQYVEYQLLNDKTSQQRRIPTFKSAASLTLTIADDLSDAGRKVANEADADKLPRAIRAILPNNAIIFYNAYVSVNDTPKMDANAVMTVDVQLSLLTKPVRYAA
jgi:hypothetical protein